MYQPHIITVMANQTSEVINEDPTTHNIHPQPANNREWNRAEPPNSKMDAGTLVGQYEIRSPLVEWAKCVVMSTGVSPARLYPLQR
jgi:hypothetical protein